MAHETILLDLIPNTYASAVVKDNNNKSVNDSREENIRVCPLCSSEVRLFFINFNEKLLMCANTECEFPFGHEELQFVKEDEDEASDNENVTIKARSVCSPSMTESTLSATSWLELEKLNRAYESEDCQSEHREKMYRHGKKNKNELELQKNIKDLKVLTGELKEMVHGQEENQLRNPKYLKSLKSLGEMTGFQLLKPEEIGLLRKEEPEIGLGELKIDINPGNSSCMSSIKIEISNNIGTDNVMDGPETIVPDKD